MPSCGPPGGRPPRRASVAPPAARTPAPPPDPDVQEFLDYVRFERGMSANTVSAYGRDLARFAAFAAERDTRPARASVTDVQDFFAGHGGDGAAASVARRTASLRAFYAYLVREGVRGDDPAAGLRTPKRPQRLPRVLSVKEVEAVLASIVPAGALGQRDLAAFELLYGCGLRVSELLGLREGDIDVEGGLVRCIGKGDKERVVPMGAAAAAALGRYLHDGRRQLLRGRRRAELILNARGAPLTRQGLDYRLRKILARADMLGQASAHTFRHSFATHLLAGGADLRSVQEMLGHASVATTQLYTHVTVEHLREVFLETHPRARRRRGSAPAAEAGDAAGEQEEEPT
jgi:integrase/recombinase XerD